MMERLGECRYCGYKPIANTARVCPKCGGANPFEGGIPWFSIIGVFAIVAGAVGAFFYFDLGRFL